MSAPRQDTGRFNLSEWALEHQQLVIAIMLLVALFGVLSYGKLSQAEDPPFTFKVMVVRTLWPGASARDVQQQVTDRIARKLQETPNLDYINSISHPGESMVFVNLKQTVDAQQVKDAWYQVRKKTSDIQYTFPQGVQGPFFNDEFGDVYTNIYVLKGDGFGYAELHDYAERLRSEMLRVPGVGKVDLIGDQTQRITVEISNARLANLGISPSQIAEAIRGQNAMRGAGDVVTGTDRLYLHPDGAITDVDALASLMLRINGHTIRLGDIAHIQRGYVDPADPLMRYRGANVLGIGISMQPGGNVIDLGHALKEHERDWHAALPAGLTLSEVASMPDTVSRAVDDFVEAVAEAVAIVLAVSLFSLGLRTGLVVVVSIPLVLAGTAMTMHFFDIGLNKVSLGTLILALGLLVDDAIIAIEMMAVQLEHGLSRFKAAAFAYTSTAFPMLTGTLVTVSGFLPIALARSDTGEYTRSIFQVSAIALTLSWLAAVIVIPLLGYHLLPTPKTAATPTHGNPYDTPFYHRLRQWIRASITRRRRVILMTLGLFAGAIALVPLVHQQFFPSSERPELLVNLTLPESASLAATLRESQRLEQRLDRMPGIDHYVDFVGSGAPRFYLPLDQQLAAPNLAQFLITAKSLPERDQLASKLQTVMAQDFPTLRTRISQLENGPPVGYPVQFRVSGPDIAQVHRLADQVANVFRQNPDTVGVQLDWTEPASRSIRFLVDQNKARSLNVSSSDVADFLQMTLSGMTVDQLRERDKLIGIDLRAPSNERTDPAQLALLAMPTPSGKTIPLSALGHFSYTLEHGVILERDRQPTITVRSDLRSGTQSIDVTNKLDQQLAGLRRALPDGYRIDIGGAVENSNKANASIAEQAPIMLIAIFLLLMIQLRRFDRVLMVLLTAPLGLIGVVPVLLLFNVPLGFVAILGIIAMAGIIMRNSVILIDQIDQDIRDGATPFNAVEDATVRRFRPICLTAAAAVLALIPLLRSTFFSPMATALMGGITIATILTLFFLPALYAAWFHIQPTTPAIDKEAL
ncbi:efflux RND transporter permease subunit [Paludibacterium purpuratum]|uniref:Multidrug efflux pump subunit AcrB n=1 Tax=Paludibacterium purpuratum TaxID=1144873 RepID=A0A4R7B290_9NEIS|nr:efflux RND transporter permease subunit [Paludibacterium purpuratum]TDR77848.1 multidrug efflux pump subunit AcrB [Paludibacterium purpuratum]